MADKGRVKESQNNRSTSQRQPTDADRRGLVMEASASTPAKCHPLHHLQHQIGNAQVTRLFAPASEPPMAEAIPMAEVGRAGGPVSNRLAGRIYGNLGRGKSLSEEDRTRWERAYGVPLDSVRIHDDDEADTLSMSVSASAFTLGNDIFLSRQAGSADRRLLGHEIAHVVQQRTTPTGGALTVGPADDALEHEAEMAAGGAMARPAAPATDSPAATIRRGWLEDAYNTASNAGTALSAGTSLIMQSAASTPASGASRIADTLAPLAGTGVRTLGNLLGPVGLLTGGISTYQGVNQMLNAPGRGEQITGGTDALFNALGAFSSGVTTAGLLGAGGSTMAALGPAGAVAGSAAGGYALGRLLDEGVGAAGRAITGNEGGDYTISGGLSELMFQADRGLSSLWADPNRPAYTQTLGWRLGEILGI